MAFCKNCGAQLPADAAFCPSCGAAQDNVVSEQSVPPDPADSEPVYRSGYSGGSYDYGQSYSDYGADYPPPPQTPPVRDGGGFGWGLLGCCLPIVGLILFLVWKDSRPKSAKAAGIGALVAVISVVVLYVLVFALSFLAVLFA